MSEQAPSGGNSGCFTIMGLLMIFTGLFAIVSPLQATIGFTVAIGWLLVFAGIMRAVWAFFKTSEGWKRVVWDLIVGGVYIVMGIFIANNLIEGVATLTVALGFVLIVQGIIEIVGAFAVKPDKAWTWLLVGGILAIVLGGMILVKFPSSAFWAVGLLIGVQLLFSGFGMLMGRRDMGSMMGGGGGAAPAASA
jgi:uncharacterized membrane protein HdeD (DUF308 family)